MFKVLYSRSSLHVAGVCSPRLPAEGGDGTLKRQRSCRGDLAECTPPPTPTLTPPFNYAEKCPLCSLKAAF